MFMEKFFDVRNNQPVEQIEVAQGETKILGIRKFNLKEVAVRTGDFKIAFVDMVIHLKDQTKKTYNDHYNIHEVAADTMPVESNNAFYFQVCGNGNGTTELTARFTNNRNADSYASPVSIKVKENKKLLTLSPTKPFDVLWANHPLNPANSKLYRVSLPNGAFKEDAEHPCHESSWLVGQCMVRFCTMLEKSGVGIHGLFGNKCGRPGKDHNYHFVNPYDFEKWQGLKQAYSWEAKPPFQPEPMPGIAAYYFTRERRGVILFWNYFSTTKTKADMFGGHIDLWNRDRMGNTYSYNDPTAGLAAFTRARKIVFWPLVPL
jgi:hypothetical protein